MRMQIEVLDITDTEDEYFVLIRVTVKMMGLEHTVTQRMGYKRRKTIG